MAQVISLQMRRRTPPQRRLAQSLKRFNVSIWGRQSGKSTFGVDKMIYRPLQGRQNAIYWYILQTHDAAKVMFKRYLLLMKNTGLIEKKNESDKSFRLVGNRWVHFKSGNNPEDLRSETLDGASIDELRQQPTNLWPLIIRPMLARRKGWCDFLTTPNGFDHCYDLAEFAKAHPDEWALHHAPSWEAPWWSPEEVESARGNMSEAEFDQEIGAQFRNVRAGQAYAAYNPIINDRLDSPFHVGQKVSPFLPIWVFCDFNVAPMHWILAQEFRGHIHAFKEIYTDRIVDDPYVQHKKLWEFLNTLPHDWKTRGVHLIGDATGKATQRTSAKSDWELLEGFFRENGLEVHNFTGEVNPPVKERVNTVNARFRSANGVSRVSLDPYHCPKLKKDLERVVWKMFGEKLDPGSDNLLTHGSDALGYGVCHLAPLREEGQAGLLKIIRNTA